MTDNDQNNYKRQARRRDASRRVKREEKGAHAYQENHNPQRSRARRAMRLSVICVAVSFGLPTAAAAAPPNRHSPSRPQCVPADSDIDTMIAEAMQHTYLFPDQDPNGIWDRAAEHAWHWELRTDPKEVRWYFPLYYKATAEECPQWKHDQRGTAPSQR